MGCMRHATQHVADTLTVAVTVIVALKVTATATLSHSHNCTVKLAIAAHNVQRMDMYMPFLET